MLFRSEEVAEGGVARPEEFPAYMRNIDKEKGEKIPLAQRKPKVPISSSEWLKYANQGIDINKDIKGNDMKEGSGSEKWIQKAVKHPGAFTKKAQAAGKSVAAFAKEKEHAPGTLGKQARLAKTLSKVAKGKEDMSEGDIALTNGRDVQGAALGVARNPYQLEEIGRAHV